MVKKYFREVIICILALFGGSQMLGFSNPTETPTSNLNIGIANLAYSGSVSTFGAGEDLVAGDIVYLKSDGEVWKADANVVTTTPAFGLATANIASTTSGNILLRGYYRNDTLYSFATGSLIYVSTDAGKATTTQPSAANDMIQSIGVGLTPDILYFNPDLIFLNHS